MRGSRTALVCPCCGKGVITRKKEEEEYIFSPERCLRIPTCEIPHCTSCHTRFEVKITYDMVIEITPYN